MSFISNKIFSSSKHFLTPEYKFSTMSSLNSDLITITFIFFFAHCYSVIYSSISKPYPPRP